MVLTARRFETGMNHSRLILGKLAAPQQAAGWRYRSVGGTGAGGYPELVHDYLD
jgi:hypothetical protein